MTANLKKDLLAVADVVATETIVEVADVVSDLETTAMLVTATRLNMWKPKSQRLKPLIVTRNKRNNVHH
tara:strand:+ start:1015 stop:1221 length:207 start_codon:yes stop_codon:yes gene_type:complete